MLRPWPARTARTSAIVEIALSRAGVELQFRHPREPRPARAPAARRHLRVYPVSRTCTRCTRTLLHCRCSPCTPSNPASLPPRRRSSSSLAASATGPNPQRPRHWQKDRLSVCQTAAAGSFDYRRGGFLACLPYKTRTRPLRKRSPTASSMFALFGSSLSFCSAGGGTRLTGRSFATVSRLRSSRGLHSGHPRRKQNSAVVKTRTACRRVYGKRSRTRIPRPGALSSSTVPPCNSRMDRTMASPSPVPWGCPDRARSTR